MCGIRLWALPADSMLNVYHLGSHRDRHADCSPALMHIDSVVVKSVGQAPPAR